MGKDNSNVKSYQVDKKELFNNLKKSGWNVIDASRKESLLNWKVMEDRFDFHTVPGLAIRSIIQFTGGDPLILVLNSDEWFGDWKVAIYGVTADFGVVLINEDAPQAYYGENGIILASLKEDLVKIINKQLNRD